MTLTEKSIPNEAGREKYPSIHVERIRVSEETAIVFSGQGVQHKGMGFDIYNAYPDLVVPFYETADRLITETTYPPFSIKEISFEDPRQELHKTEFAQLAILCYSQVYFKVLLWELLDHQKEVKPGRYAGPSSGGISALVASGATRFNETFNFVKVRAKAMQEASDKAKYSALRVFSPNHQNPTEEDEKLFEDALKDTPGVTASYINSSSDCIVSGPQDAIANARITLRQKGVRSLPLDHGPFHTDAMLKAVPETREALGKANIRRIPIPIVSNTDGKLIYEPEDIIEEVLTQMTNPVNWKEALNSLVDNTETILIVGNHPQTAALSKRQREKSTGREQQIGAVVSKKGLVIAHILVAKEDFEKLAS